MQKPIGGGERGCVKVRFSLLGERVEKTENTVKYRKKQ
jgi:hypothetical protein